MSATTETSIRHGAALLPGVAVDSYNLELRENGEFLGDRANSQAFQDHVEQWRAKLRESGADPFGDTPTERIGKRRFDALLAEGDPATAGVIHSAIEDFAATLAAVIRRFMALPEWAGTERIAIGGGFRAVRIGELAIGRAGVLLNSEGIAVDLRPIRNDPNEAGLIGAAHLMPTAWFAEADGLLAVDIGGSHIRCGVVRHDLGRARDLSRARIWRRRSWTHRNEDPGRDDAVARLAGMLEKLIAQADKQGFRLAPYIGVGCPGVIRPDGGIDRGAQNLPGDWAEPDFHLPGRLESLLPRIGRAAPTVILHNDAVVQGLSEAPRMRDVAAWGVLTIGTGLGNARFTNRADPA